MVKLGLVLGGGGAKGSYQLGVLKALKEYNLLDELKVVSGTSIGAFNACLIMEKMPYDMMYDVWRSIDNNILYKESFDRFKTDRLGMFDQTKMYEILIQKSDKEKVINSDIKGYVAASLIKDNSLKNQMNRKEMESVLFCLNNENDPHKVVLASSSVPVIFGATEIDGNFYVDGGMLNNVPINALEKEECNVILSIALNNHTKIEVKNKDTLLIDFSPKVSIAHTPFGMLDFSLENLESRIELGYNTALEIIKKLEDEKIIDNGKWKI